jgi:hypothetical protein
MIERNKICKVFEQGLNELGFKVFSQYKESKKALYLHNSKIIKTLAWKENYTVIIDYVYEIIIRHTNQIWELPTGIEDIDYYLEVIKKELNYERTY